MKITVLNCSPKGKNSLTFTSFKYLEKMEPGDTFEDYFVGSGNLPADAIDSINSSDIIVLTSSLFHSGIHAQMFNLLDSIAEKIDANGKIMTYFVTSNCIGDEDAFRMVQNFFDRNGFNYVEGMSLHTEDIREEFIREAMYNWFEHIKTMHKISYGNYDRIEVSEPRNAVILNTTDIKILDPHQAREIANTLALDYKARGFNVKYVDLNDYTIAPCTACCNCYTSCKCVINDDFDKALDDIYTGTDLIVLMGRVKYGALGYIYKKFLDRHVQFGRLPMGRETVWNLAYINDGETTSIDLRDFDNHLDSFFSYLRDIYVGSYDVSEDDKKVKVIDKTVSMINNEVYPHMCQYRDALDEKFGRLAFELQNMCPSDYKYYKNTFYSKELEVNEFVRPYTNPQETAVSQKMRVVAVEACLQGVEGMPAKTKRRRYKNLGMRAGIKQRNEDIDTGVIPEDTPAHLNKKPAGMMGPPPGVDTSGSNGLPPWGAGPPPWIIAGRSGPSPEEILKYGLTGPPPGMARPSESDVKPLEAPTGAKEVVERHVENVEKPNEKPVSTYPWGEGPPPWILRGESSPTWDEIVKYNLTGPPPGAGNK